MYWRDMTAEELVRQPEARLGGALLWMVIACAVACVVPTLGMVLAFVVLASGGVHANPANIFSWLNGPVDSGISYMIPVAFFMVWSLLFVVMTLARVRATPAVASIGIVLWVILRFGISYLGQAPTAAAAMHTGFADALVRIWPFAIGILAEAVLAAAFCGYMATGVRPNAYYRRRLPAVPPL
jgi:hypothetical protein